MEMRRRWKLPSCLFAEEKKVSDPTMIMTQGARWKKLRSTNTTDNGFPSRIPRATRPSGIGDSAAQATASAVHDNSSRLSDFPVQNVGRFVFFGAGSNNNTFSARLIAWDLVHVDTDATEIWIPTVLFEVALTISSTPIGLAGRDVVATDLFADTISLTGTTANDDVSIDIVSPANDTIAHLVADLKGAQLWEMTFTTGGSATNCNALYKSY